MASSFDCSLQSGHWLTKGDVFCFMKPCRLLQGRWMRHTLDIPNVEEKGEVKDFEGKRMASHKAAAGHQAVSELVYVHIVCWNRAHHLPCLKRGGGGSACEKGAGRDGNATLLKIDDVLFYDVRVLSVTWFLPTGLHAAPLAGKWVHTFRVSTEGAAQGSWKEDALPWLQHDWLVRMCPSSTGSALSPTNACFVHVFD